MIYLPPFCFMHQILKIYPLCATNIDHLEIQHFCTITMFVLVCIFGQLQHKRTKRPTKAECTENLWCSLCGYSDCSEFLESIDCLSNAVLALESTFWFINGFLNVSQFLHSHLFYLFLKCFKCWWCVISRKLDLPGIYAN